MADVALILPVRPGDAEEESMANDGAEEWEEEEEEEEEEEAEEQGKKAVQYLGAFIQDAAGVTGACDRGSRVDSPGSGARQRADGGGRVGGRGSGVQQGDGGVENGRQLLGEMLPGCGREGDRRAVPKARRTKKSKTEPPRFLAHSLVLGARSEKFAAMLRFVRRQDVDGGLDPSDAALDDGSNSSNIVYSSSGDIFSSDNGGDYEHSRCAGACGIHDGSSNGSGGRGGSGDGDGGGNADAVPTAAETSGQTMPEEGTTSADHVTTSGGMEQEEAADPKLDRFSGLQEEDRDTGVRRSSLGVCACRRRRRLRRDLPPRVLELHSPLFSRRSLGLFLEFLYTGVLDPGLSAGELSELALVADEYLVPDLTQQVEMLLVERLVSGDGR